MELSVLLVFYVAPFFFGLVRIVFFADLGLSLASCEENTAPKHPHVCRVGSNGRMEGVNREPIEVNWWAWYGMEICLPNES